MNPRFCLPFVALALAGCSGLTDMSSEAFDPGHASYEQFDSDNDACVAAAEKKRSWDIPGIAEDRMHRHEIFNRAYAGCMTAKGYRERRSLLDLPERYDF